MVELRQAGDPLRIADLAGKPIPPDQNADVFLRRAASDLDAIQKELLALYPKRGYPTGTVTPAEQDKLEKVFAAYPKFIPLVEQAAECPNADPQLDCTLPASRFLETYMDHTSRHRPLERTLRARSALLVSKGRLDDAVGTYMLTLRLARHWRREPLLMSYLMTAACEQQAISGINQVLQAGPIRAETRQSLDRELALHDTMEGYNWALRSERAFALTSAQELPGDGLWHIWLTRGLVNDLKLRLIEIFDQYLQKGTQPYYSTSISTEGARTSPGRGPNPLAMVVRLLEPPLNMVREPTERTRAVLRCLRVLNALQVRAPNAGDQPPRLNELGLPSEATIDPFSGEPLKVIKRPDGWMVYSIGKNLVDDGGELKQNLDVGVGPSRQSGAGKKP